MGSRMNASKTEAILLNDTAVTADTRHLGAWHSAKENVTRRINRIKFGIA